MKYACGNSLEEESYELLMKDEIAQMVITDPPYNVKIDEHVCGNGDVKHDEFAMAATEMSAAEFTDFLKTAFSRIDEVAGTARSSTPLINVSVVRRAYRKARKMRAYGGVISINLKRSG